ncbi:MdlB ABC-type multidrug transport system ATPase and permease component [Pyrenophora tritici-repentis]|uniref:ABC transporter n=3 Tax=Pyrenophora tritici-repentis TaxID=45151 RepID=A0A2W1FQS2_9PLEO|nr:multidrug resistance-associated protein 1 [Pyrenophora tritici-repentis Pt-1C-BFP]KAF7442286.1 Multidrug resistance-associated protein [Pyrenophora tritici-repentis]EDU42146.1 multidrug resistance-associated protein 1 [Pyrenophora tritici-repentis Pt-1C-BFP]KAI0584406.1 Multidrug resistance-associated protein 1 [Pyrenophora tritici-repentis]KAI0588832.1 Multidrug resistance-associated protein 1 [Pyrenophora tritici-repentis]KAI0612951.1 Multidrug resistance-associated protein 1 [Pyrenophora
MPLSCPIHDETAFGPVVVAVPACYNGFDFTLLFEEIFFSLVPNVTLTILLILRVFQLQRRRPCASTSNRLDQYWIKQIAHISFIHINFVKLIVLCVSAPRTPFSIPTAIVGLFVALCVPLLTHLEHYRSPRPTSLLSLYLGLVLLFDIVRTRTLWIIQDNRPFAITFSVGVGVHLILFLVINICSNAATTDQRLPRETRANVYTRGLFWWLNPLFWLGSKTILDVPHLPAIDTELRSRDFFDKVWEQWSDLHLRTPGALLKLLFSSHKNLILEGVLPRLALSGFTFSQPFLLSTVVSYATATPDSRLEKQLGNGLIGATAFIYIGLAIANANAQHKTYRVITKLRGTLVSLIYTKTLTVSVPTAQKGSAVTLMSADVERTATGLRFMHECWASCIDIGVGIYLLQRQLGPASAAPGVVFLLCSVVGLQVAASMGQRQRLWLEGIEKRIKATSDTLAAVKEVRMGGLQVVMEEKLRELRQEEIKASRKFKNALALIVCLSYTTAAMGPVLSFGIYSLLAKRNNTTPVTSEIGFTALSIFSLLRTPMAMILDAISGLVAAIGAIQRIGEYMSADNNRRSMSSLNLETLSITTKEDAWSPICDTKDIITASNFSAGWSEEQGFVVRDATFSITPGSLTFIVGPVGCGKSTLLHAMLDETTFNEGHLLTNLNSAAFAGQAPWLINDTIQNNIVATSTLDQRWYGLVLDACALREDIARLPNGDREIVDDGGSNLSGGQQARVGLARAVYSRRSLIFMDDVMSGLDATTEEIIFSSLLGPEGLLRKSNTTVVFATNALHRLSAADHIIVLAADGTIAEQGPYWKLASSVSAHVQAVKKNFGHIDYKAIALSVPLETQTATEVTGQQRRTGDFTIYKYYVRNVGLFNFTLFFFFGAVFVFALIFPQYIVGWWAAHNVEHPHSRLGLYLGTYFGLAWIAIAGLAAGCLVLIINMMPRASSAFHNVLLRTTLDAPLSLFSGDNVAHLLNRFSQDLQLIDMELPLALFNTSIELLSTFGNLIVIAVSSGYIAATMPAVLMVFFLLQKFYLRTARQLRLLDIEAKGPLFSHFLETLSGLAAIRAYNAQKDYKRRFLERLDYSQKPFYLLYCVQRWLNLVLDSVVAGIAIVFIAIAVQTKGHIAPGLIGTALVSIINFGVSTKALLENWTNLEMCIGAVSRIRTFALTTPSEHQSTEICVPPPDWPSQGHVSFSSLTASWKDRPTINNFSVEVSPASKTALIGASGCGKSTILSSLLNLVPQTSGIISIDGIPLSMIGRQALRERLLTLPQAPFLLPHSSIRKNLNPFDLMSISDDDIYDILTKLNISTLVANLPSGLDTSTSDATFSIGQKQLLCLARVILRHQHSGAGRKLLVMDEATASLDFETDKIVQRVLREEVFGNDMTVLVVAHRMEGIRDFDCFVEIGEGGRVRDVRSSLERKKK